MGELKRCPFCGCRSVGVGYIANRSVYYITCANCEATGPEEPTKEYAVRKWNRVSENVYEGHGNDRLVNALERVATSLESQCRDRIMKIKWYKLPPVPGWYAVGTIAKDGKMIGMGTSFYTVRKIKWMEEMPDILYYGPIPYPSEGN